MNCPYCNNKLKPLVIEGLQNTVFACTNLDCRDSVGMIGTELMWSKVTSLLKIRNANKKYISRPEVKEKRRKRMREWFSKKYATDPEFKQKSLDNKRKWVEKNKEKVAAYSKQYRETHREYFNEYMKNYKRKKESK